MKRIKDRPMYPALEARIKLQEERIHLSAVRAYINLNRPIGYATSSFYSDRFIPKSEAL